MLLYIAIGDVYWYFIHYWRSVDQYNVLLKVDTAVYQAIAGVMLHTMVSVHHTCILVYTILKDLADIVSFYSDVLYDNSGLSDTTSLPPACVT